MGFVLERPVRVTRRVRVVGHVALVLVVAAGALAWRETRPNYDPDTAARTAAGVTVLVYTEDWGGGYSAVSRTARLVVLAGDCLGLTDGSLLVFPNGSRALERGGQVAVEVPRLAGEGTAIVGPGDLVDVGGGGTGVPIEEFGGHLGSHVPASCRGYDATSGIELAS